MKWFTISEHYKITNIINLVTICHHTKLLQYDWLYSSSHVWMWGVDHKESWALKNWWFWTVCWRRLLRVPWTARKSKWSILKEINPEYSLEEEMLKLKLWPPHAKNWLIWKDSDAGKDWRQDRGWDGWMASLTQWTWVWVNSGSWCWTGRPGVLQSVGSQRVRHNWATELNWTNTKSRED